MVDGNNEDDGGGYAGDDDADNDISSGLGLNPGPCTGTYSGFCLVFCLRPCL